jgi:hypothetical protein
MPQGDHDGYDYMVDEYDAIDVDDEAEEIMQARERVSLETDSDEDENENEVPFVSFLVSRRLLSN